MTLKTQKEKKANKRGQYILEKKSDYILEADKKTILRLPLERIGQASGLELIGGRILLQSKLCRPFNHLL